MISDLMKIVDSFVNIFKKKLYGKTFFCPVCHLELSFHDTDENGNLVCPLCGVVIELHETYGHPLPIVNDVEINRAQPKMRLHPFAAHLPIGLFPLAFLGSLFLLVISIIQSVNASVTDCEFCSMATPIVNEATLIMLAIAVISSLFTFLTGFSDWKRRYGGRPYRIITLKLILSGIFAIFGLLALLLHFFIFSSGIITFTSYFAVLSTFLYFGLMGAGMFMLATLGHVGGYLVFGK